MLRFCRNRKWIASFVTYARNIYFINRTRCASLVLMRNEPAASLPCISYFSLNKFVTRSNDIDEHAKSRGKADFKQLDDVTFERVCEDTLESLAEYFEEVIEKCDHLHGTDVTYGDGVLTVKFGSEYGTYVINRQSPNKQIWLSSPFSGPKRYDFSNNQWVYRHDGVTLHDLLNEEISAIVKFNVDFRNFSLD